jgi:V/A-type H+-transporting ATPase subunit F
MSQAGGGSERAQIAVVGNRETVVAFQAAGLSVHPVAAGPEAAAKVEQLVAEGFRVIFFTEELFAHLGPVLERYRKRAVPCLVALPESAGSQESVARLKEVVKRAVGADVFGK